VLAFESIYSFNQSTLQEPVRQEKQQKAKRNSNFSSFADSMIQVSAAAMIREEHCRFFSQPLVKVNTRAG